MKGCSLRDIGRSWKMIECSNDSDDDEGTQRLWFWEVLLYNLVEKSMKLSENMHATIQ